MASHRQARVSEAEEVLPRGPTLQCHAVDVVRIYEQLQMPERALLKLTPDAHLSLPVCLSLAILPIRLVNVGRAENFSTKVSALFDGEQLVT